MFLAVNKPDLDYPCDAIEPFLKTIMEVDYSTGERLNVNRIRIRQECGHASTTSSTLHHCTCDSYLIEYIA